MAKLVDPKLLNLAVLKTSDVQKKARIIAENKLAKEKAELINGFKKHPVSKEISQGPSSSNSSGTLGGYGNLFSFIGFDNNESPVENWANFIDKKIRILKKRNQRSLGGNNFRIEFDISQISEMDYIANAKMPWESGRSWLTSIERGISGFSSFISKKLGRSGGGIQTDNKIRSAQYRRTSYWSPLWTKFVKNLKEV